MRDRWYVGLAATMHDPALAIVDPDGRAVFAEAAERRLQDKRAYNCPPDGMVDVVRQVHACCPDDAELVVALNWSAGQLQRLEAMVSGGARHPDTTPLVRQDPFAWPFPRAGVLVTALRNSVSGAGLNLMTTLQLPQQATLRAFDHHRTHAAHAAWSSPFEEATVAVVDAFGESASCSFHHFREGTLTAIDAPATASAKPSASLGFFYARLCALCGFDAVQGEEWKVMGLAAYGSVDEELYRLLRPLIAVEGLALVAGCSPVEECRRLQELRELAPAPGANPVVMADMARTGQFVFEETLAELLTNLHAVAPAPNLAYAGGCALNSSFNGRIVERTPFEQLHVPSAPADDGTALGAALLAWHEDHPRRRPPQARSPYLGSRFSREALDRLAEFGGLALVRLEEEDLVERVAALLADGAIVAWVHGRAEFGPRALGNRSVLADPRPRDMRDRINGRVKFREEFRPFAPAILDERGREWFEEYQPSPYMERTLRFRPEVRGRVPAVVHEDGTGRVQSVRAEWNPLLYGLVAAFERRTGVPILLNTSLNVMGRPIVHALEDVLGMFLTTGLDVLVVEECLVTKPGVA